MASLVLKNVSEADLLQNYTCKLEPDNQPSRFVTISLDKKRMFVNRCLAVWAYWRVSKPSCCRISSQVLLLLPVTFPWLSPSPLLCRS